MRATAVTKRFGCVSTPWQRGCHNPLKYNLSRGEATAQDFFEDFTMSAPSHNSNTPQGAEQDAVEAIVPLMPIVLPFVGAVTMLLIAFIAVFMA
jgi:hypothetical protein